MIGAFVVFVVLFGLIKVFERGRDDLDGFVIGTAAVVPVLIIVLAAPLIGLLELGQWGQWLTWAVFVAATYLILTITLEIRAWRAVAYTAVVLIINEAIAFAI